MSLEFLNNISWHSLAGPQAMFSSGTAVAKRYAAGFSPIIGFADVEHPDFVGLEPYCQPGEHFYCAEWTGSTPPGWRIDADTTAQQLVWDGAVPELDDSISIVKLDATHLPRILELVAATEPGPFGIRTIELGDYFGVFDGERLVAMAGERLVAGTLREISGVCTHPNFQGRGLARRLIQKLVCNQLRRGQTPFLQVTRENAGAQSLYVRMGFRFYREKILRVISLKD